MKKLFLLFFLTFSIAAVSQSITITPETYAQLKLAGQLQPNTRYVFNATSTQAAHTRYSNPPVQLQSSNVCNCMIPLDSTFFVVPFQGSFPPDYRNDDFSSPGISLPFSFNYFGTPKNAVFINNNGNISFDTTYFNFTADSFPTTSVGMIAPFWADVDTRDSLSGLVYYKITPTYMVIKWDSVGYFNIHSDKRNSFQLIITNGLDSILPPGNNVGFCYGDMEWTTGDASAGVNGFGGVPATVGVNQGNGVDYFQVGRFDTSGYAFNGPYGTADEVSWLDDLEVYFNIGIQGNVPPFIMNSALCDTIDVFTGDTLRTMNQDSIQITFRFFTPEINQTVTASFTTNAPAGAMSTESIVMQNAYKEYICTFRAKDFPPGVYTITATASDNGFPAQTSTSTVIIRTYYDASVTGISEPAEVTSLQVYPNPGNTALTLRHDATVSDQLVFVLTDVSGRVVSETRINSHTQLIELSGVPAGLYFGSLVNEHGVVSSVKIIRN
ncbi:MAG: T9SS type A sorting domain-containing protein [Bacteroidetes bacterium]|nr:T9SS type A sorting domain-containing protein [Bacteroidota bacterium]